MRIVATVLAALCIASAGAAIGAEPVAAYRTELFNLLLDKESVVDGKNRYRARFAAGFDALLASSRLARSDKTGVPLKKRLLSGPAAEGEPVAVPGSASTPLYYTACQAHRCDEVSLGLLFDPASQRMVGKLRLDGQEEYLGSPSEAEQRLLDRKMSKG